MKEMINTCKANLEKVKVMNELMRFYDLFKDIEIVPQVEEKILKVHYPQ